MRSIRSRAGRKRTATRPPRARGAGVDDVPARRLASGARHLRARRGDSGAGGASVPRRTRYAAGAAALKRADGCVALRRWLPLGALHRREPLARRAQADDARRAPRRPRHRPRGMERPRPPRPSVRGRSSRSAVPRVWRARARRCGGRRPAGYLLAAFSVRVRTVRMCSPL